MSTKFLTRSDQESLGQHLRDTVPAKVHREFAASERDPVAILSKQNESRLQDLVPVRWGRMLQSPFAYYRATAAIMAGDLRSDTVTGPHVVCCGDAHISNFGLYASPERSLIFDLNDFDEGGLAPWEWDLKRLVTSVVVGGRSAGFTEEQNRAAAEKAVNGYRDTLTRLIDMSAIDRYFLHVDHQKILDAANDKNTKRLLERTAEKARSRTSQRVLTKLTTTTTDGHLRIAEEPPIAQHVGHGGHDILFDLFEQYRNTLRADTALLLNGFRMVDYVLRVVGVGSVGTRCYVLLLVGPSGEPLFLQAKEANQTVLQTHGGMVRSLPEAVPPTDRGQEGYRVVSCQRILQAQSDPFLGWITGYRGDAPEVPADYYWRQFRDMKGSFDLDEMSASQFADYSSLCARLLARAHSQSTLAIAVACYLKDNDKFDGAVARWAEKYADQTERDFAQVEKAAKKGLISVEYDV